MQLFEIILIQFNYKISLLSSMYAVVDALIFPAPSSHYTQDSLEGKLIYVPKFKQYVPDGKLFDGSGAKNNSNTAKRKR